MKIQPIPTLCITLDTLCQGIHFQRCFSQTMDKLRGIIDGLVQIPVLRIPVPLTALPHPAGNISWCHCARNHFLHQIADNLLIDQAEIIDFQKIPKIPLCQLLLDVQYPGTFIRKIFKSLLMSAAILPAP